MKVGYIFTIAVNFNIVFRYKNFISFMGGYDPEKDYLIYTVPEDFSILSKLLAEDLKLPNVKLCECPLDTRIDYDKYTSLIKHYCPGLSKLFIAKSLLLEDLKNDYDILGFLDVDVLPNGPLNNYELNLYNSEYVSLGTPKENYRQLFNLLPITRITMKSFPNNLYYKYSNGFTLFNTKKLKGINYRDAFIDFSKGIEKWLWCADESFNYNVFYEDSLKDINFCLGVDKLNQPEYHSTVKNPYVIHFGSGNCPYPIRFVMYENKLNQYFGCDALFYLFFDKYYAKAIHKPHNYNYLRRCYETSFKDTFEDNISKLDSYWQGKYQEIKDSICTTK